MSKKSDTTVASPPATGLSAEAEQWFNSVEETYSLADHHRRLLFGACAMWDRAQWAREVLNRDGLTYRDRFDAPKPRPEIAIERDSFNSFRQLVGALGLDADDVAPNGKAPHLNSRNTVHYGRS